MRINHCGKSPLGFPQRPRSPNRSSVGNPREGGKRPSEDSERGRKAPLLPKGSSLTEGRLSDRGPSDRHSRRGGDRRVGSVGSVADGTRELSGSGGRRGTGSAVAKWTKRAKRTARKRGIQYGSCTARVAHAESELERRLRTAARQSLGSRCDSGPGRHRGSPNATGTAAAAGGRRYLRTPARQGRDASPRGRAVRTRWKR